jgi:hypothetical protein
MKGLVNSGIFDLLAGLPLNRSLEKITPLAQDPSRDPVTVQPNRINCDVIVLKACFFRKIGKTDVSPSSRKN